MYDNKSYGQSGDTIPYITGKLVSNFVSKGKLSVVTAIMKYNSWYEICIESKAWNKICDKKYPKVIAVNCSLFVLPACHAVFSPVTSKTGLIKLRATNFYVLSTKALN